MFIFTGEDKEIKNTHLDLLYFVLRDQQYTISYFI